jgi:hypothetical protein
MTPDDLTTSGLRLYGQRWQGPLAIALGVNGRTLRRWVSGQNPIPESVADDIATLIAIAGKRRIEGERN